MADIRFHIRNITGGRTWFRQNVSIGGIWKQANGRIAHILYSFDYPNLDEVFHLHARHGAAEPTPTNDIKTIRIIRSIDTNTYDILGLGSIGSIPEDTEGNLTDLLVLNITHEVYPESTYSGLTNWYSGSNSWTNLSIGFTYDEFKTEIIQGLADKIKYTRDNGTNSGVRRTAMADDWNVHINYEVGLIGSFTSGNYYIVIFYPGDDPEADETITKTV